MSANRFRLMLWALMIALVLVTSWASAYINSKEEVAHARSACARGQAKNLVLEEFVKADREGNEAVAADPAQPPRTKQARHKEAVKQKTVQRILRSQESPSHGGTLSCSQIYPSPPVIPVPW